ncbi:NADH:ubiquinone reductase (Na(+)-transporting) subunit C [Mangrovivirga cuniculi]|uniref:Na(+)-translocating NADH-quinone reductase subunit C n=1 Tax=Mangrovivirga cuniculi TaxID=2715131 RepID=A0A4D7K5T1_9BACT|nr:NADH:ubiquinone reductase (Na(+)-transporting) subunit C [Mangrovivirga cuniculi]QCK14748.1 NADH:ubiquinone reductase (Na(+)-transporting) subunit C [Mangrovivirga cuniculi]
MRQSNGYVIFFTAILTVVVGGAMALTSVALKPAQQKSIELDTKSQILSAVTDVSEMKNNKILTFYDEHISSLVVDVNGEEISDVVAEKVNVNKQFRMLFKAQKQRREAAKMTQLAERTGDEEAKQEAEALIESAKAIEEKAYFPVFKYTEGEGDNVDAYIFPVYGNGLWNNIFGYIALENNLNVIKGVSFGHVGETPGLGARITNQDVKSRYNGKTIFSDGGELVSVTMVKGEGNPEEKLGPHKVDGMSGATLTANGVNQMLDAYLHYYLNYIDKNKSGEVQAAL